MTEMVTSLLRRAYSSFASHIFDVPARLLAFLLFLLFLVMPLTNPGYFIYTGEGYYILGILVVANIYAIYAASWDILAGRTGQLSLGHALFYGIGAYTVAILYKFYALPLWVTIPIGILVSVSVALLVGFPCLRVKGPYLSLVTLAFPLILTGIFFMFKDVTGGELGISSLPAIIPVPPYTINQQRLAAFYFSSLLLAVSSVILYKIANSKIGIIFVSMLDDEVASKASGINTTKYKLLAFAISALFASLAGAFAASYESSVGISMLALTMSFYPVIMTILGGIGTIYGPIIGAFILTILDRYVLKVVVSDALAHTHIIERAEDLAPWHMIIYTSVVIIFVLAWPRGVTRFVVDKLEDLEEARELEEIKKKKK